MRPFICRIFFCLFLCLPAVSFSQHDFDSLYDASSVFRQTLEAVNPTYDLFESKEPVEVVITSDFKNLQKNKGEETYQPALITYPYNDTVLIHREIKIRPRGNHRREYCRYPPLLIKFPKKDAKITQFQEFNKMKIVVDCGKNDQYEQYLISEYLIYKLYNLFSDYSFRVLLLKVKYVDTSGKYEPQIRYAFIIEDENQLAERMGGYILKVKNIHQDSTSFDLMNQQAVFQFMIGNTDWSVPALHNIKLLSKASIENPNLAPVAVPYDFDFSGMVNAIYAIPPEKLGINSVRDRVFRGYCRSEAEMEAAFKVFRQKKAEIYSFYQTCDLLDEGYQKQCLEYLDEFFEIIEDTRTVKRYFLEPCKDR